MGDLLMLAQRLLINKIISSSGELSWRSGTKIEQVLIFLAGFMIVLGLGYLVYAAHLWLHNHYSPDTAAALMGGLLLSMAIICSAAAFAIWQARQNQIKKIHRDIKKVINSALDVLDEELSEPVGENPKTAVAIASLAGFAAGERFIR